MCLEHSPFLLPAAAPDPGAWLDTELAASHLPAGKHRFTAAGLLSLLHCRAVTAREGPGSGSHVVRTSQEVSAGVHRKQSCCFLHSAGCVLSCGLQLWGRLSVLQPKTAKGFVYISAAVRSPKCRTAA